jgi:hypothetical protein
VPTAEATQRYERGRTHYFPRWRKSRRLPSTAEVSLTGSDRIGAARVGSRWCVLKSLWCGRAPAVKPICILPSSIRPKPDEVAEIIHNGKYIVSTIVSS